MACIFDQRGKSAILYKLFDSNFCNLGQLGTELQINFRNIG